MIKKKIKPHLKTISKILPEEIEYFCKTRVIDELIMLRRGKDFDSDLADEMEIGFNFFFVVKKNQQYDVISGKIFEPFMVAHGLTQPEQSPKALTCIDHYIKNLKK